MRRDYYKDLGLRAVTDQEGWRIVWGNNSVAKNGTHLDVGDEDIEAAVEAATITAEALGR